MRILLVEPGRKPEIREIDGELHTIQDLVGGMIQVIYPFSDPVALVCSDDGKLLGLPGNRVLQNEQGQLYDVICGSFFLCGAPAGCDHFVSLTKEQTEKYQKRFKTPKMFLSVNGQIIVLPMV